jgi:hypothetical protein
MARPLLVAAEAGSAERLSGRLAHRVDAGNCSGADRPAPYRPGAWQRAVCPVPLPPEGAAGEAGEGAAATSAVVAQSQPAVVAAKVAALQPGVAEAEA